MQAVSAAARWAGGVCTGWHGGGHRAGSPQADVAELSAGGAWRPGRVPVGDL